MTTRNESLMNEIKKNMMVISTPNKKSIISLFNDQLKGFHRCYYSLQFCLVCMASTVKQSTNKHWGYLYEEKQIASYRTRVFLQ